MATPTVARSTTALSPTTTHRSEARGRHLSRWWRNLVLSVHIAASVALVGDSAAFLAISLRARGLPADEAHASYEILGMLSVVFGIPLSFIALGTGIALGLGSRWGVFRYPWSSPSSRCWSRSWPSAASCSAPPRTPPSTAPAAPPDSSPAPPGCLRSARRRRPVRVQARSRHP